MESRRVFAVLALFFLLASAAFPAVAVKQGDLPIGSVAQSEDGWHFFYHVAESYDKAYWVIRVWFGSDGSNLTMRSKSLPRSAGSVAINETIKSLKETNYQNWLKSPEGREYIKSRTGPVAEPKPKEERPKTEEKPDQNATKPQEQPPQNATQKKPTKASRVFNYTITEKGDSWWVDINSGTDSGSITQSASYSKKGESGLPIYRYQIENIMERQKAGYINKGVGNYTAKIQTPDFDFRYSIESSGSDWLYTYTYGSNLTEWKTESIRYPKAQYPYKEAVENAAEEAKAEYYKAAGKRYEPVRKAIPAQSEAPAPPAEQAPVVAVPDPQQQKPVQGSGNQSGKVRYYYGYNITDGGNKWVIHVVYGSTATGSRTQVQEFQKDTATYAYIHNAYEDIKAAWLSQYGERYSPQYITEEPSTAVPKEVEPPAGQTPPVQPPVVVSPVQPEEPTDEPSSQGVLGSPLMFEVVAIILILALLGVAAYLLAGKWH